MLALQVLGMAWLICGGNTPATAFPRANLQTWISYCNGCHGDRGEGYRGFYIAPRLAQQNVPFFEKRLETFAGAHADTPVARKFMRPSVKGLSPKMRRALANHYERLAPAPAADGPKRLTAKGRAIFEAGIPEANIVACITCHGPEGKGHERIPRLAGQLYRYLVAQIRAWKAGFRHYDPLTPRETGIMKHIAETLTSDQASAVAAYLSRLK